MDQRIEKINRINETVPVAADLLTLGIFGIMELVNVIKYDRCEIYIENNHCHNISVVLDIPNEYKLEGWYNINAFTTKNIYKTKRKTYQVGIYAECRICKKHWGNEKEKYIPKGRKDFMIDRNYKKVDSCFNEDTMFDENCSYDNCEKDNQRCIKLSYVKGLEKKKKHIYTIE